MIKGQSPRLKFYHCCHAWFAKRNVRHLPKGTVLGNWMHTSACLWKQLKYLVSTREVNFRNSVHHCSSMDAHAEELIAWGQMHTYRSTQQQINQIDSPSYSTRTPLIYLVVTIPSSIPATNPHNPGTRQPLSSYLSSYNGVWDILSRASCETLWLLAVHGGFIQVLHPVVLPAFELPIDPIIPQACHR